MNNELYHHGVKGMKWGKRRYQNPDGSLTALGLTRQAKIDAKAGAKAAKSSAKSAKISAKAYKKEQKRLTIDARRQKLTEKAIKKVQRQFDHPVGHKFSMLAKAGGAAAVGTLAYIGGKLVVVATRHRDVLDELI